MTRFQGRTLDRVWFWFFVLHIVRYLSSAHRERLLSLKPVTMVMDLQAIYPPSWIAGTPLPAMNDWYLSWSRDPVITGAQSGVRDWQWIWIYLHLEGFLQLPCFFLGAWGLWRNDKRIYPVLLFYGASTFTTVIPVIYYTLTEKVSPPFTTMELTSLMGSYIPFLIIPLVMALDMGVRITKLIQMAENRKRA